jgi:CRISPR-associated endoribonuclease Cas6
MNKSLPYIIYALKEAEALPVGKSVCGKKGSIRLQQVKKDGKIIYSNDNQTIYTKDLYSELKIPLLEEEKKSKNKTQNAILKVHLITPLRLKFRNKLKADLPFHVLIRAVLRRISSLFSYYGDGEPELDYKGLVRRSESVKTVESDVSWFDWKRYSFRQDQAMLMGGIIGSVTYEGNIGEFIPLIKLCEKLHIGKQTSFGLGKIKAELLA